MLKVIEDQNEVKYPVVRWIDAGFYPRNHKLGFHARVRCEIRDRHLVYNSKKKRWEEPVILIGTRECLYINMYHKSDK